MHAPIRPLAAALLAAAGLLGLLLAVPALSAHPASSAPPAPAAPAHPAPAGPCWTGDWQAIASYPITTAYMALTAFDTQLYGFGGRDDQDVARPEAYSYDPADATWTRLADLPLSLRGTSAISTPSGIYILNGGFFPGNPVAVLYRYDPAANTYTPLATPPVATEDQAAVYLDGKIYRIGGDTSQGPITSVDVYTIATDTWVPAGTIAPYPDQRYALAAVTDGRYIYAAGGVFGFATGKAYRYDPASNVWDDAAVTDFPHAFGQAASSVLDGRWIVAGGSQDHFASAEVWALDLQNPTGAWVPLPPLPAPRRGVAGATLSSAFYAVAGADPLDHNTATTNRYAEAPCPTATPTVTGTPPSPTPTVTSTPLPAPPACLPSWHPVAVPSVAPLSSVAASGPSDAWAVAAPYSGTTILHWDGAAWATVPTTTLTLIAGIAATGPADAWVVGQREVHFAGAAHWDGRTWQNVCCLQDQPAAYSGAITGVAAARPGEAWMVEGYNSSGLSGADFYHCIAPNCQRIGPPPQFYEGGFAAVAAPNPNVVWVAGWIHMAPDPPHDEGFLARWNGAWTSISCPNIGYLSAVAATGPDDAWAIAAGHDTGLLHWDGQVCQEVPLAAPANSVLALAPYDAWAAGNAFQHWDGTAWHVVPGPAGLSVNSLAGSGPADLWAAGQDGQGRGAIAHYAVPPAFADVPVTQPFFRPIEDLACRGLVSGYTCGGPGEPCLPPASLPYYRVGATVTRAQLIKMVVNAAGWPVLQPASPTFSDVPPEQPFYAFVETAAGHGIVSGYACGGPGEPCDPEQRPYLRPYALLTRAQIAKIITLAQGYPIPTPVTPTYADVPASSPFYGYVEAAAAAGLISGYTCGGPGEPCDLQRRPYFRPAAPATRGQTAKIVAGAFLPSGPP